MTFKIILSFVCCSILFPLFTITNHCRAQKKEKPEVCFAVLTDLHSQQSLIDGELLSSVRLRGTINSVLQSMKQEEDLDFIALNGDYTSDVCISEANWLRVRDLMADATRNAFKNPKNKAVLYCNGNHEYEVANFDRLPKPYNAGDFYTKPMKQDIGTLDDKSAFYEYAQNDSLPAMKLLAAFHYKIKGIDCVVLNTGKYFFKSAWDYQYSIESVKWIEKKLDAIYAKDPNKTVFFFAHLPFADSKNISAPNKGLKDCASTKLLKQTLSKYPHLVFIYGHDHGGDKAFIQNATDERVTEYAKDGSIYTGQPNQERSFTSIFAGSMRYYKNTIDKVSYSTVLDSRVAQALLVYVYKDKIVFQMKNYAKTGTINAFNFVKTPSPYILNRKNN